MLPFTDILLFPMIAASLGRLFEVGFNLGILTYIQQNQLNYHFLHLYKSDLKLLRFPQIHQRIVDLENLIDTKDRKIVEKWCLYFLQKGFLSGLSFFREYLESFNCNFKKLEIIYYQCNFCQDNSFGINPQDERETFTELLSQLGDIQVDISRYKQQGEFLKADTLILLRYGTRKRQKFRILCADLSVFSVKKTEDIQDLENVEVLRKILIREIKYLRSKSVFAGLSIDTGNNLGITFSEDLNRYFTAFKREDKESSKLIQAGSYAYSFYQFLKHQKILQDTDEITLNVMGYTDRGVSAMSVQPENIDILKTCQYIYQKHYKEQTIAEMRSQILGIIQNNAAKSFTDGKKMLKSLLEITPGTSNKIIHQEKIKEFYSSIQTVSPAIMEQLGLSGTMTFRDAHASLIRNALKNSAPYLFLTGNPGIGKTTAIIEYLKQNFADGFLFFYVSPRTQVNLDVIQKFKDNPTPNSEGLFCINTNANLIQSYGGRSTVQFYSVPYRDNFTEKIVHFVNFNTQEERLPRLRKSLQQRMEDIIEYRNQPGIGVLNSLSEAIATLIEGKISQNIVATTSIQSLKKTANSQDTLSHLDKIFRSVYNTKEGRVIPSKMRELAQRFKQIIIMIDEITGDDSGVEFLERVSQILEKYHLNNPDYGINTKIIVADASIVEQNVIEQHLSQSKPEPDKIFYRRATQTSLPLLQKKFTFRNQPAILIDANSYPASSLNLTYKIFFNSRIFSVDESGVSSDSSDEQIFQNTNYLIKSVQGEIAADIHNFLANPDGGQMLVYIQNKQRLTELIYRLKAERENFEELTDYLTIHASISDNQKQNIQTYKDEVKVIFMTASASRGLSFPKTKHILVDIPQFEIEQNLMEIIQVIYRGRGSYQENGSEKTLDNTDKNIIFYVSEQAIYYPDDELQFSLKESLLNLVNLLLILKTAIMTRIFGQGKLGHQDLMMIPIGGKSVFSANENFSSRLAKLIKELQQEYSRNPSDRLLQELSLYLQKLFSKLKINLKDLDGSSESTPLSYLAIEEFANKFLKSVNAGLDQLLNFPPLNLSHICGSLLIVPVANKSVQETYEFTLMQEFNPETVEQIRTKLFKIMGNKNYSNNLRAATSVAIELLDNLLKNSGKRSQWLEQNSKHFDRYYAIPLFTYITHTVMQEHFSSYSEQLGQSFREILSSYVRALFPINNTLPIGINYENFPFILFTSYSLGEIRDRLFTDKQLLTSNEFNILNLILSQE
jgi:hypothetical protein